MLQFIKLLHMYVLILIISITSPFLSTGIWRNFSSSSVVPVVPFSLTEFSALSCYSLSSYVLKPVDLFRVASLRIVLHICSCVLSDWSFFLFLSRFCIISFLQCLIQFIISILMHGPSMPCFLQKLLLSCYLWFIFWHHLLWLLFLRLCDLFFILNSCLH